MRPVLVVCVALLLVPSLAFAQGGIIALFADSTGTDCGIVDSEPNTLIEIYVLHVFAPPVASSQFSVPIPDCAVNLIYLGDYNPLPFGWVVYTSPTGVVVTYGACYMGTFHILTIRYWGQGLTGSCCAFNVETYPRGPRPGISATACSDPMVDIPAAAGTSAIINPDETCPCSNVPVAESTWGKVKALYR